MEIRKGAAKKPSGSGSGHEVSTKAPKWQYYDRLQFLIPYISPPDIKSSRDLREGDNNVASTSTPEIMPEFSTFGKRRKLFRDQVDEKLMGVSETIEQTLQKLVKDHDQVPKKLVKSSANNIQYEGYCAAVIQNYRDLPPEKKFTGFATIIAEIQDIKLNSN